jgi:glucosylglycerate synthase
MDASLPELEQIESLGGADLVVGILDSRHADESADAAGMAREAAATLGQISRTVVVCNNGCTGASANAAAKEGAEGAEHTPSVYLCHLPPPTATETPFETRSRAYRSVFTVGGKLGARACGVIASQPEAVTPQWIYHLVRPVLDFGFDLVAPHYSRQKMEGLLNRSVLAPLHRALYGDQLQNPMGPDFGLSGKLLQHLLTQTSGSWRANESDLLAGLASTAAVHKFQICESHLGPRSQPPTDWMNLGGLLAQVLGPVFLDVERQAVAWQRIRGSIPITKFGLPEVPAVETGATDVARMIESFHLGVQNLQDVWGAVLPPTTLLEVRKLSRLPAAEFHMADEVWVRIIYDFALGHRLRTISRDHLLRSLTPLYVGWCASYARDVEAAGPPEIEERLERLSVAYESAKSYLVQRWRWPDRFNP